MKQKIPCYCDNTFDVDVPAEINLDSNSEFFDQIQAGTFLNFTCPGCGKKHKPEFPLSVLWPSKQLRFEVFPELERGDFYRRKDTPSVKDKNALETIIGYPELADRLALIRDGFEPAPVEAIKYNLHLKAEDQYPDAELDIWYAGFVNGGNDSAFLKFHIHGIRKDEVAVIKIPHSVYQKTWDDFRKNPKSETFSVLRVRTYLSVKNTMRPEELK